MTVHRRLSVWLEGTDFPIGTLDNGGPAGAARFRYAESYLEGGPLAGRRPLSLMLPVKEEPFSALETEAFFGNLLQENELLSKSLIDAGIDTDDTVAALGIIGKDCAGAVSFAPFGEPPPKRPGRLDEDYEPFGDLEAAVSALAKGQPVAGQGRDASPLAGVQPKIALTAQDGAFLRPKGGAPTTHILKIAPERDPGLADNEAACLSAAAACGLDTVSWQRIDIGAVRCLLVERYDRTVEDGTVTRRHQEDFAQALGLKPLLKYERKGANLLGHRYSAASIAALLAATDRPAAARLSFLRLTLLNLVLGNVDNHAKNHALLYGDKRRPGLAPAYDLVTTRIDPSVTKTFAFDLGRAQQVEGLSLNDLVLFAETLGLRGVQRERQMASAFEELSDVLSPQRLEPLLAHCPPRVASKIKKEWLCNIDLLGDVLRDGP